MNTARHLGPIHSLYRRGSANQRNTLRRRHTESVAGYEDELAQIVAQLNSAAPGSRAHRPETGQSTVTLDQLLVYAARRAASDVLVIAGASVILRVNGAVTPVPGPALSADDTRGLLLPLLSAQQYEELQHNKSVDLCFTRDGIGRFRGNIHHQRGTLAGSIRLLPEKIPTLESLRLPATLRRLADARQGLILVTGPTGCGKSSTLAALVDLINSQRRCHIVTIEDPVEFVHPNRSSIIEQIEVGHDTPDFASSVRSILRHTPEVILVGEMRDPETMSTVLTAAETGHLVLSTLHTNDTSQAVSRILDSFPAGNQPQIRQQLSLALSAIIAQQLVPSADESGRYPACEIMAASGAVRNLIRKGEDHQLYTAIGTGRSEGMMTMEQSLAEMVRAGRIGRDRALAHCFRPEELRRYLQE
jgi:twitching motility protein PilT